MMLFRRLLTIPLVLIFLVIFILMLVVSQLNGTVGSADFYNDQLERADMYNFVYDEAIPAALDEVEMDDLPVKLSDIKDDIVSVARKVLPPEWLQDQVESATTTFIPYAMGDTDEFTYTLALKERVKDAAAAIKSDILDGDTATTIYNDSISYAADKVVENLDQVPYPLILSKEQIEESLRTIASQEWITAQGKAAIDSITPYLTGDSDQFTITLQLYDQIDPAAAAIVDLVGGQETYDFLLDEFIPLMVKLYFTSVVQLPFDISLSQDEISSAIKQVLPQSWVQERLEELVDSVTGYVKGDTDNINITIRLADRKATALVVLTDLADQKLQDLFDSLTVCDQADFLQILQSLSSGSLPGCRPAGVTYQDFKNFLNIDIASFINQMIGDQMPDQWVYTDVELRWAFGEDNEHLLDDIRDWVSNGYTFTEADLLDNLDSDAEQTLDDARDWISNGYSVNETDLNELIEDADQNIDTVDDIRHWTGTGRTWLWALWIIPLLLLLAIGFLGARKWRNKLYWMLTLLFVVSLIIYIATGVVYSSVGEPRIEDLMFDAIEYEGVAAVAVEKGNEVIINVSNTFITGMKNPTLYMMIGSGVILAGLIALGVVSRGKRSTP